MAEIGKTLTKTDRNLWNAIVDEALALLKYNAYSHKALEEGNPEIAQIFQEVAGAELIHGVNHLRVAGEVKSSVENLRNVTVGETREFFTIYPRMIKEALDEGRMDAAQTFTMAMDREKHHLDIFSQALEELEAKDAPGVRAAPTPIEAPAESVSAAVRQEATTSQTYRAAAMEIEQERWRVAAFGRIREVVFGAQDGLLSTVALVTAVATATTGNTLVLVAGLAGGLAGMVSMATGAFLGSRAEQDVQRAEIEKEALELEENPAEELAELVVIYQREGMSHREAREMADHIASDKDLWLRTLVEKELGISPDMTTNPLKDAITMGGAFIMGAMVPIIPYFFLRGTVAITTAVAAALAGLFALGIGKGRIVQKSPILQGLEILTIGAAAAGIGFLLGEGLPRLIPTI